MKPLIIANWKCNPIALDEAREILNDLKEGIRNVKRVEIVICPPFLYLPYWVEFFSKKEKIVKLGAQDCFWKQQGAYTGEISPQMLKNFGCQYAIIGHSERRRYFQETNEMVNKKIKSAIAAKLKPVLCIGETEKEKNEGKTFEILKNQLKFALKNVSSSKFQVSSLIVAYEPVWAIGTGNPCRPPEAKKVFLFLRKFFKKNYILYGGSVNSENASSYIKRGNFNGLLVGGASLNPKEFIKIAKKISS